jgi:O-antigen/teichoic acid export membrane protein
LSDLKKKGISALIWDFFGKLSSQGVGFVVTLVLARLLEPSDFGLIAIVMVVVGITQIFSDMGLGGSLIQRTETSQLHYSSVFFFNILIASLLTFITYNSASFIANFYNNQQLVPLIKVISFMFVVNALLSIQRVRLRKALKYALITKIEFTAGIFSGITGLIMAFNGFGVWSLAGQIIGYGIVNGVLLWFCSNWRPSLTFSFAALKELWAFGFRMFLSQILDAVFTRLDYLIIGKLFTPDVLGYYQRAKQFNLLVIKFTSGSLMSVLFPVLSQIQNDLPRFQLVVLKTLHILCFAVFLLLGGLYLVSEEVIVFLYSEKWLPSVHYMQLLLLSGFGYPLSALLVNVLSSRGNSKLFLRLEILKKLVHSLNFINAIYLGIESYLYGLVIVTIISLSLNIVFAAKEIKLTLLAFYKPITIQLLLCVLCVSCTLFTLNSFNFNYLIGFFFKGCLFVVLFTGLNILFRTQSFLEIFDQLAPLVKKKIRDRK